MRKDLLRRVFDRLWDRQVRVDLDARLAVPRVDQTGTGGGGAQLDLPLEQRDTRVILPALANRINSISSSS